MRRTLLITLLLSLSFPTYADWLARLVARLTQSVPSVECVHFGHNKRQAHEISRYLDALGHGVFGGFSAVPARGLRRKLLN